MSILILAMLLHWMFGAIKVLSGGEIKTYNRLRIEKSKIRMEIGWKEKPEWINIFHFICSLFEHIKICVFDGVDNVAIDVRDMLSHL